MRLTTACGSVVDLTADEQRDIWNQAVLLAAQTLLDMGDTYARVAEQHAVSP